MRRDAIIISFVGALLLLLLLVVITRQPAAFLPFAFLYLLSFAGQVLIVYAGSQWAGISLKILYPVALLAACGLLVAAVAWLSENSLAYLLDGFFSKSGLGLVFAPYIVANLVAYVLIIIHNSSRKHTL